MPSLLLLVLVSLLPAQVGAPSTPDPRDPWQEGRLPNGLAWVTVDAPLMTEQVMFTLVPWGLLDDHAGQTQLCHLAEHALTRAIDPAMDDVTVDGIMVQGETMALTLRLETYAPVDRWAKALGWHADWLAGRVLTKETLRTALPRERAQVRSELELEVSSHFTHKWALAAWNQVVRHGAEHVPAVETVDHIPPEDLLAQVNARVAPGPEVLFVSVGPVPRAEVLAAMTEALGQIPARAAHHAAASVAPELVREVGERRATWDVGIGHYLEWYPVPDEDELDRVAADALVAIMNNRLRQRGALTQARIQAFPAADLITPEGRWLLLSASLPTPADEVIVRQVMGEVVDGLASLPEAGLVVTEMTSQLGDWPDFARLRDMLSSQPGIEWIEAMQTLFLLYAQINMELSRTELPPIYARLSPEFLQAFASEHLVPARRSVLVLSPKP